MNNKNKAPFEDGIKILRKEFKQMIDEMPDEEFISLIAFFMSASDDFDDFDDFDDDDFDDDDFDDYDLVDDDALPF